jgi:hypothetical protein
MSERSLTGYDNRDAVSGQLDEEDYLYHASSNGLVCASCNPTGARPVGAFGSQERALNGFLDGNVLLNRWVAASIPGWTGTADYGEDALYQSRYLSDSGRLFFDSSDALVPQDVNGTTDVYEYESPGVGGCERVSATFGEASGGCVALVSSGGSPEESVFLDASENGDDVFFETTAGLVPQDYDGAYDVYDAHVCSAQSPCVLPPPALPPPCVTEASCRPAPVSQPSIFGEPSSATFSGAGNVVVSPPAPAVGSKSVTRSQKLTRALAACRKVKKARKRVLCERQARRRYAKQAALRQGAVHPKQASRGGI